HSSTCSYHHDVRHTDKDHAGAANDNIVVTERRYVGTPGRAMAHYHRDLRHTHLRQDRLVAENAPSKIAVGKKMSLQRKESTRAVTEMNDRKMVLDRDI